MYQNLIKLATQLRKYDKLSAFNVLNILNKIAAQVDDLILQYPQYEAELNLASNSVKPAYLKWVIKQLDKEEPINEIINMISEFEKNKQRLEKKDLFQYQSLGELRGSINDLGMSRRQQRLKGKFEVKQNIEGQYDILYDDEEFLVIHPHSKEASCYFGRGTQWCVAATNSKNYFTQYAADNVFLYYIITRNNQDNPDLSKIAYSIIKYDDGTEKTEIFNARDSKIQEDSVIQQLGDKYSEIKNEINNHFKSQEETAYRSMISSMTVENFNQLFSKIKENINKTADETEKEEFLSAIVLNKKTQPEVLREVFKQDEGEWFWHELARNPNTPLDIIDYMIDEGISESRQFTIGNSYLVRDILSNPKLPPSFLLKIWNNLNGLKNVLDHPNSNLELFEEVLKNKTGKSHGIIYDHLCRVDLIQKSYFEEFIISNLDKYVRYLPALARNSSLSERGYDVIFEYLVQNSTSASESTENIFLEILVGFETNHGLNRVSSKYIKKYVKNLNRENLEILMYLSNLKTIDIYSLHYLATKLKKEGEYDPEYQSFVDSIERRAKKTLTENFK